MHQDRVTRVEAVDKYGNLLTGAQFKVFIDGQPLGETEGVEDSVLYRFLIQGQVLK
jgi:hypothetical protein